MVNTLNKSSPHPVKIPRLVLVDLLRFLSFIAIGIHHFAWIFWYTREVPSIVSTQHYTSIMQLFTETYARSLSFSGFTIVGLASYLQAFTKQSFRKRIFLFSFLLFAWAIFCLLIAQETGFYPGWDVYPLLFTGLLTCVLAERLSGFALRALGIVGYFVLLVPFWNFAWFADWPFFLRHVFVGVCENDLADWPVLPWIGLVWMSYWAGWETKRVLSADSNSLSPTSPSKPFGFNISKRESILWLLFLAASVPQLGAYFHVPLGRDFPCFVYRQQPYIFWSHFIWVVFIVRISFDSRIHSVLDKRKLLQWISGLAMTRHFWLAYIIHYCLAYVFNNILDAMGGESNWWYMHAIGVIYGGYFFMVEYLTRWILKILKSQYLRKWPELLRRS